MMKGMEGASSAAWGLHVLLLAASGVHCSANIVTADPNDGNEGDEGDEGNEGTFEGDEGGASDSDAEATPAAGAAAVAGDEDDGYGAEDDGYGDEDDGYGVEDDGDGDEDDGGVGGDQGGAAGAAAGAAAAGAAAASDPATGGAPDAGLAPAGGTPPAAPTPPVTPVSPAAPTEEPAAATDPAAGVAQGTPTVATPATATPATATPAVGTATATPAPPTTATAAAPPSPATPASAGAPVSTHSIDLGSGLEDAPASNSDSGGSGDGAPVGAIVGGSLAGLALLLAVLAVILYRRRRGHSAAATGKNKQRALYVSNEAAVPADPAKEAHDPFLPPPPPPPPHVYPVVEQDPDGVPATLSKDPPQPKQGAAPHLPPVSSTSEQAPHRQPSAQGLSVTTASTSLTAASTTVSSSHQRSATGPSTTSSSQRKGLRAAPTPPVATAPTTGSAVQVSPPMNSGAGTVGTAAGAVPCVFPGVATRDSVSNYATQAGAPMAALPADATAQERREHLEEHLDRVTGRVVGGSLKVLPGAHNRLAGGQAVVQIVEDTGSHVQYAIKFFLSMGAFRQERSLYTDPGQPLGRFLPQMLRIAEGTVSGLRDAQGAVMAPCIVMEKGEALDVWIQNSGEKIDMFTGLQVLSHIADRLKDLHASGYVHRDIKPGNIMWLPRKKRWTLIDFGCAARIGMQAPTGFSLFYAAPEALRAYVAGEGGVETTEALDAWSLGVLAIELFTGNSVFDHMHPRQDTIDMILGGAAAPWEDGDAGRLLLRPLGVFKPAVLGLLRRDPAQRSTIQQFLDASRKCLANTSITAT